MLFCDGRLTSHSNLLCRFSVKWEKDGRKIVHNIKLQLKKKKKNMKDEFLSNKYVVNEAITCEVD